MAKSIRPVFWDDERLRLLDQRKLPETEEYIWLDTPEAVAEAIINMTVRGAPAIGIAAAYGVVLAVKGYKGAPGEFITNRLPIVLHNLRSTRPTAVNLFWALNRMERVAHASINSPLAAISERLLKEAEDICGENLDECRMIGRLGAELLPDTATVITVCNAGALATAGYGTALGVIRSAVEAGKKIEVFACETRPRLQGASLTTWELMRDGIDVTLITDNMAAYLMSQRKIDAVIAGADRIASNGDTANKIGTYMLSVLAAHHAVPFYIAAPLSTVDMGIKSGEGIHIEHRSADEIRHIGLMTICPPDVKVWNPSFDVTPSELITAIITEKGIVAAPYYEGLITLKSNV